MVQTVGMFKLILTGMYIFDELKQNEVYMLKITIVGLTSGSVQL